MGVSKNATKKHYHNLRHVQLPLHIIWCIAEIHYILIMALDLISST